MSLRVIGNMHQQSSKRRLQGLPAYNSTYFEISADKCSHAFAAKLQRAAQFRENISRRRVGLHLRSQAGQLVFTQLMSFGISEKSVDAARDMPQVKGHARDSDWACIQFFCGQVRTPSRQIFVGQLQRVQHRAMHCRNFRHRPAKPRFNF